MSYRYISKFVDKPNEVFERLWNELDWERHGSTPRRECYSNDNGKPYTYGNPKFARTYEAKPWHKDVLEIRWALEKLLNTKLDVCFINGYEDHRDHLGWHADDSPEMDDNRPIVTVSFGAERYIWFRKNSDPENVRKVLLENGSSCIMLPGMQDTHMHRIPKHDRECGPRISLTYRGYID